MEEGKKWRFTFAILPDVQLGRELFAINFYDPWWLTLWRIPQKEAVVGEKIAERLKKAVEWINNQEGVQFVASIGDLTDSGTSEQFREAREILDKLTKPFIPMMGNHDVWPYQRKKGEKKVIWEAERPLTVSEFEAHFREWKNSPCFENFEAQGGWLQNYAFTVKGVRFVVVDNNNRRKAPFGLPGQTGWSKLYPKSKEWLTKWVLDTQKEKTMIILSHATISMRLLKRLAKKIAKERKIIDIAGHTHKRTENRWQNITILTTNALYHEPLIFLGQVSQGGIKFEYHRI